MHDPERDLCESPRPVRGKFSRSTWIVIFLIAAVGAALRVSAARDQMWIDEIASWNLAHDAHSAAEVFFGIHLDNNHYLNTLWMYLIGDRWHWMWYRLPSIVFGSAATLAAAMIAGESIDAIIAALLVAGSYFLIEYSSEARGYAPAMFFALLAFAALRCALHKPSRWSRYAFAVACVIALLFQLTFLYVYFACLLWSAIEFWRRDRRHFLREMLALHVLPLATIFMIYVGDIARMTYGGGPTLSRWTITFDAAAWILGGRPWLGAALFCVIAITIVLASLQLIRAGKREWIFYVAAIVAGPTLLLIASRDPYVYARYYVLATPFYLLLIARLLGFFFRNSRLGQVACVALLALYLVGNAYNTRQSIRFGRGHYLEALRYIESHSGNEPFTVGSPHDGRNQFVVDFYRRYLPNPGLLQYVPKEQWPAAGPEWVIVDVLAEGPVRYPKRLNRYDFAAAFPHSGISGVTWFVYRRE